MTYTAEQTAEAIKEPRKGDRWSKPPVPGRTFHDGPHGTGEFIRYKVHGRGNLLFEWTLTGWRKYCAGAVLIQRGDK